MLFVCFAVVAALESAVAPVNHVANPGFEDGMAPWRYEGPEYVVEQGAGRGGGAALRFTNENTGFYRFPRQMLKLKPGRAYRYEFWVKTELRPKVTSGAACCIEWNDEKGKHLGGAYCRGLSGTNGWTKISAVTPHLPLNATSIRISPLVPCGMLGRCWFDDFTVTEVPPRPVGELSVSAYRGLVTDGTVRAVVQLELDKETYPDLAKLTPLFRCRDAAGAERTLKPEVFTRERAEVSLSAAEFASGRQRIAFALTDEKGQAVGRAETEIEKCAALPKRRVMFDSCGRTLVDGKKFFPLGMYWANPLTKDDLETYAKGPFNALMPYVRLEREALDRCQKLGLMSCCNFGYDSIGAVGERGRKRIAELKDHPALLAWYVNDEESAAAIPMLTRRYDMLVENDPDHPVWAVEDKPDECGLFLKTFDVIGTDPYPLSQRPMSMVVDWTRRTRRSVFGMRPMWMVPQSFDYTAYRQLEGRPDYAPTTEQISVMTWMAIAEGANGIFLYSFHDLKKEIKGVPFDERWKVICAAAEEVKKAIPILLLDPAPVPSAPPEGVSARAWQDATNVYVLAVNATDKALSYAPFGGPEAVTLPPWGHRFFTSGKAVGGKWTPLGGRATAQERMTAPGCRIDGAEKTWRGNAWRNERVHATFVVWGEPGAKVELRAKPLVGSDGKSLRGQVRTRQVLESFADDWVRPGDWTTSPSYLTGEALDDELPVTLNDRGYRAVWVTVRPSADAAPGAYRGGLEVACGEQRLELPIELEVLPMALPQKRKMYLDIWQTPWTIARYYKVEPFSDAHFARLEPIYRELADAGQQAITLTMTDYSWNIRRNIDTARSMIEYTKGRDGKFRADFSLLDRYVAFCKKCGLGPDLHFYALARFQQQTAYWYWDERTQTYCHIDCKTGSPEFRDYWRPLLRQLDEHAHKMGWDGHVYVALDELLRDDVKACSDLLAETVPTFKFQMAGCVKPSAFEGIRIHNYSQVLSFKHVDEAFLLDVKRRREQGFRTTGYVCCWPRHPNCLVRNDLSESRWIGLYLAAKGFDGFLKSTSHRWMTETEPLVDTNCRPHFPCGDSYLLYPGPRSSVRWETMRDGWEDYDKIAVLREKGRFTAELAAALKKMDLVRLNSVDEKTVKDDLAAVYAAMDAAVK